MKLRRVCLENVRSFLGRQQLELPGELSIVIGPNGGGKTNLLDVAVLALRTYLLKSWVPRHNPSVDWQDRYDWAANDALGPNLLERHSSAGDRPQIIQLDLEVTAADLENMKRTKAEVNELSERARKRYTTFPGQSALRWDLEGIEVGRTITFEIENGSLKSQADPIDQVFREYLENFEIHSRVREEHERKPLSMPMISLPVTRAAGEVAGSVSLASFNEYDHKRNVDAASSRSSGSIGALAVGRLAARYRDLLERDDGQARAEFRQDEAIQALSDALRQLGYEWDLECTNPLKNQYDVRLRKQGASFRVSAASSGERELLTYLFAIFALNVRDALIVIDEPELHLHPRWQRKLLGLFEDLAERTGNQFLMATHSPVFVSPSTIQYVSRVYSDGACSQVVRLGDSGLPEPKHLFGIVNSQNNERVFFADLVVLVEGISDRLFFEAVFAHLGLAADSGRTYEVVSVGGKTLFTQYEKLLVACKVPHVIIADLDYLQDVEGSQIGDLFSVSDAAIRDKVLNDSTSRDGATLVAALDRAIEANDASELKRLWNYIKRRHSRLPTLLDGRGKERVAEAIQRQAAKGRYILSKGALEQYLPDGYKDKDLEKLVRLVAGEFWQKLPPDGADELKKIAAAIQV